MIKTRNSSRDRDSKGRFEKFCGAIIHDNNESEYQLKLKGNKVKNEIKSYIFQNNIVKKHTLYICTKCIEKVQCLILKNTDVNAGISCTTSISFQKKLDNVEEWKRRHPLMQPSMQIT